MAVYGSTNAHKRPINTVEVECELTIDKCIEYLSDNKLKINSVQMMRIRELKNSWVDLMKNVGH